MSLSNDLISQFVKATKDTQDVKKDTVVYGTIQQDENYVLIDGSNIPTPVIKTVVAGYDEESGQGDRVTVMIKNHTAIVTGNLTNQSARECDTAPKKEFEDSVERIDGLDDANATTQEILSNHQEIIDNLDATYIRADELDARYVTAETLEANYAKISRLTVSEGKITDLEAANVTISGKVAANEAAIKALQAEHIDTETLNATYATINNLNSTNAELNTLKTTKADIEELDAALGRIGELESNSVTTTYLTSNYITASEIESTYVTATKLASEYAKTETLESNYAKINLANVKTADIGTVLANAGLITSATIVDGHVTGYLDSVQVNANDITAGTLTVDRLVISGTDKSIVYALNNAGNLTSTEVDTINGDVITKRTIAADHIIAGAITANELHSESVTSDKIASKAVTAGKINVTSLESIVAKIGSFSINNSLYSNNHSAYNTANNGVYICSDYISLGNGGKTWLKNDGSVSIGNGAINYNATSGVLDINASSVKMESQALALKTDADNASKTATNHLGFDSNGLVIGDLTASSLGKNVLIDSSSVKIRTGTTENAKFGADTIELAKYNEQAVISMLNDTFKIYYSANTSEKGLGIYGKTSTGEDRLAFQPVNENDNLTIGWGGYNAGKNSTNIYGHNIKLIAGNDMTIENDRWQINIDGNLFGKASNDSFVELIGLSSDNNTAIGHGGYTASLGKTNIYGNKIQHIVNTTSGSASYKPYYEAGDSFETEWYGAGFISSSSKIVYFSIPLAKPVIGNKTPTVTVANGTTSGGLQIRQSSQYVFGSTSSAKTSPASYSAKVIGDGNFVQIEATMANTTNAVNNEVCGINASIKITFS